jgi:clan AA aspartic protease
MGEVKEKITLVNAADVEMVERGFMKEHEVRQLSVEAVVDTGSTPPLIINEALRQQLGLRILRAATITVAGNGKSACSVVAPVTIRWKDRETTCRALLLPNEKETLLGVIPLEDMDLLVNPVDRCLAGAHGDEWVRYVR